MKTKDQIYPRKKGQMVGTLGCGAPVIFASLCNILSGGGGFNSGGGGGGFNSGGGGGGLMPYRWRKKYPFVK